MRTCALLFLFLAACSAAPPRSEVRGDDLVVGDRLAAHFEHPTHDPAHHLDTCKPYHHLYAPDGRLLTKGLGGLYEHHRGLFLGWNQIRSSLGTWDLWHCSHGETLRHEGFAPPEEIGLGHDWQVARITWRDGKDHVLLRETRALRALALDSATTQFDVQEELIAELPLHLNDDAQHSGHQFRALQAFAEKDAAPARYVTPPGAQPGKDDTWTGCAWIAQVLPLPDGPVTVVRVELDGNPDGVIWSTRSYGRFGATFARELAPGQPLRLSYAYVVALGELDANRCAALADRARARR